ncbi:hypothetical protein D1AOALGA4SA_11367 [Olavius algarvensis Delta 1 endosymbiont]|nr:hypothetical protein D1AOALGA4SA_11367 [Olavius algarvensis Delta 1 endosymbiont]
MTQTGFDSRKPAIKIRPRCDSLGLIFVRCSLPKTAESFRFTGVKLHKKEGFRCQVSGVRIK